MAAGYSTTLRNAQLDAITAAAGNAALLRIYDGARPATGGAVTVLLAELVCGTPFAPAAAAGVLTANAITSDASANNTGTASWARLVTSGSVFVMDLGVGLSATELILNTLSIVATAPVQVTSFVITRGNA
jgi:transcriptional regulator of nitric oxide reductase